MSFQQPPRQDRLLEEIDKVVAKYQKSHPNLAEDLSRLRALIVDATNKKNTLEYARLALQVVNLIKLFMDLLL